MFLDQKIGFGNLLRSRNDKSVTPLPKTISLWTKNGIGTKNLGPLKIKKKTFFWAPQNEKMIFFQKPWNLGFGWALVVVPAMALGTCVSSDLRSQFIFHAVCSSSSSLCMCMKGFIVSMWEYKMFCFSTSWLFYWK